MMNASRHPEHDDFVQALLHYVSAALRSTGEAADYCQEAVRVVDARNHLFASAGVHATDDLRDLCTLDDETMEWRPDAARCAAVARDFGL